jgi:acetyl-CoA carboxylase carboxyltransferase component
VNLREMLQDLAAERQRILEMGGPERRQRQHARGKWDARARMHALFDGGAYFEVGLHGTQMGPHGAGKPPADAVVCGWGQVDGRNVAAAAYDFTVLGGSMGYTGETKVARMRELALRCRMPMVWFVDSGGARIDPSAHPDMVSMFAGTGHLFREQAIMSGVVPQVAAMVGPGAAGTAYVPALADFVPMLKDRSSMALGGPALVRAVTGQEVDENELGGSRVHTRTSGVADMEVDDDAHCIAVIKEYLGYFPSHCEEPPPLRPAGPPICDDSALLDILPDNPRAGYDMYRLLSRLVDEGRYFDIKGRWAKSIITCLARIDGVPCGIVASNPKHLGGVLEIDSADKAARFVQLCDAFNLPLVFLVDVPGFMVGSKVEHEGIIRHGAKMLHCVASATVPKVTVIVRKAYGAGYYVMCGRAYEPDLLVAWPGAEISVMGAEGMVGIAGLKAGVDAAMKDVWVAQLRERIDIRKVAGWGLVDDIIDPQSTRRVLAQGLRMSWQRKVDRPWRKRGVMPV